MITITIIFILSKFQFDTVISYIDIEIDIDFTHCSDKLCFFRSRLGYAYFRLFGLF